MERLQALIETLAAQKPHHQAIMAVESGNGSFRWSGAAGEAVRGEPLSSATPVFIASIDKTYNTAIVMLLVEQGQLSLDDPISAYLPGTLTRNIHVLNGVDHSEKITIRHLLSHTSGLPDWLEEAPKNGHSLVEQVLNSGDRSMGFEEIAGLVRRLKPHFPPQDGTARRVKVRYSDTNFLLTIALIETVYGQPLHQVHTNILYEPLGLRHTYFPGVSQPLDTTPLPVPLRAGGQVIEIPGLLSSFRGIYSTTGDMIAFLRSLTSGQVFQKPETLGLMQAQWNRFGFPTDRAALRSPNWPIAYGLGLMKFQIPRVLTAFKRLPAVIGHSGSTGSWLFWCPEMDLYFAGSVDEIESGAVPYRAMPKMLRIFQEELRA